MRQFARRPVTRFLGLLALLLVAAGWDPGLKSRCVSSPHPSLENYYEDTTECTGSGQWLAAVHSGDGSGVSCPGPNAQSFPMNEEGSPISIGWQPVADAWAVTLATDLMTTPHPCGNGYWTWFMFFDHVHYEGGPLPPPDKLRFSAFVNYSDAVSGGSAKGMASWQGYWDGLARYVEIVFQSQGLADAHPDPLVINYPALPDRQYVLVDGAALGISVPEGTRTRLRIAWDRVVKRLIKGGYLDAPSDWTTAQTLAVGLGHEVKGNQTASLWFEKFLVTSL